MSGTAVGEFPSGGKRARLHLAAPPFDQATLEQLYRTHGRYVSEASNVTERNLLDGFIVGADAEATVSEAAQTRIGKN